jgi:type IV secretion system protein VirD4
VGRAVAVVFALCLGLAALASAQVPDATVQRLADIDVQLAEVNHLWNTNQIDNQESRRRKTPLVSEREAIARQIRAFAPEEQRKALSQAQGLMQARLALLEPQWKKEDEGKAEARKQHDREVRAALSQDARAALEPQRRRLQLQQRRARNDISPEALAAEDKKALDEIAVLRNKYQAEGAQYATRFDTELALLTQALGSNPATPLPVSVATAGTTPADYQKDLALASGLAAKLNDASRRYSAKTLDKDAFFATTKILESDLSRLTEKWRKAGRDTFERDYARYGIPRTAQGAPVRIGREASGWVWEFIGSFILLVVVVVGIYTLTHLPRRKDVSPPVSAIHGTAQFAPVQEEVADEDCVRRGVFLGKSSSPERRYLPLEVPGAPICSSPQSHTLIVAPTRTGKGTRVIVPTLLRYAGSALVIDPKGENAAITARVRESFGQTVHILNPWGELADTYGRAGFAPATYNPLDAIDRNDPNAVAIAQALADAICPTSADRKDAFWQGNAASILAATFLWLADQPGEQKTLARAREITSLTRRDFNKYLAAMAASTAFGGAVRELAAQFVDMPPETYGGVMAALSQCMRFLSDPQVKAATSTSSFSMAELIARKTTVYVVIPPDRIETQKTWLRLVLAAGMHTFKRFPFAERPGHRCLFLIDEFPALGRLDDIPRDIATISGYGLDLALVVQGLDQLKDHYREAQGTILSNCGFKWFCNVKDLDTAKWLSEAIGKMTVRTTSTSESHSQATRGASAGSSTTHSETGRSLLNPDEILNLGRDVALVLHPEDYPHFLQPVDYWELEVAFSAQRERHPALYWDPPLEFDANPYVKDSGTQSAGMSAQVNQQPAPPVTP